MISLKDINKAIVSQVKEGLKDTQFKEVGFATTDITEKISRPSFFIEFSNNKTGLFNAHLKERNLKTKIYYFAKNKIKPKLELMNMQEELEKIFLRKIKVNEDFYIPIVENEFETDKENGYLVLEMNLYTLEMIEDTEEVEFMEELNLNNKNRS